ncbi:Thioredoxin family protein [Methylomonas albis]|jgi:thiol-disulfide isomerase/thioredoxin|uniref:TlpA family protein disulfide reductase n=1 Tax=Methylomonas albis TaxID=1854563 RepID=A0ABR9D1A7_9GAMM|nr:TlpA disulfide reductase family protein [Methylomonas albis]MBD9356878.1 TlpA family protein disulfide reductase [Methylomonas albis]CAD6880057.1 Thioredoxin family protein [Methylomonas albis]
MKKKLVFLACFMLHSPLTQATALTETPPACPTALIDQSTPLNWESVKGRVVLIDFWATWCPPCIKSMPFFNSLRRQYQSKDLEIIAVNIDEDSELARQFLQIHPVEYKLAFDPNGDCPKAFDLKAMPSSYLVDKTGKIRKIFLGFREEDQKEISNQVELLLREPN